jgi:hypothetical protein
LFTIVPFWEPRPSASHFTSLLFLEMNNWRQRFHCFSLIYVYLNFFSSLHQLFRTKVMSIDSLSQSSLSPISCLIGYWLQVYGSIPWQMTLPCILNFSMILEHSVLLKMQVLPVVIDVGTNNRQLLENPQCELTFA